MFDIYNYNRERGYKYIMEELRDLLSYNNNEAPIGYVMEYSPFTGKDKKVRVSILYANGPVIPLTITHEAFPLYRGNIIKYNDLKNPEELVL